eukprot:Sspe_Gene.95496::Locus_67775_Transcript_1_1_Confidence_1.000_Length_1429::g.95496::m.95496/K15336/TRDMT1, DNMT2; tRNA (cytosine38-C5)-methyltransferase
MLSWGCNAANITMSVRYHDDIAHPPLDQSRSCEPSVCDADWEVSRCAEVTAIDFFSGIGGNHYALCLACEWLGCEPRVLASVEINDSVNRTYRHNFPQTRIIQKKIEDLPTHVLERLRATVWLMSPPCQPFTRQGLQKDDQDPRTLPLFHLLRALQAMRPSHRPLMLFIENVKNFEESRTHAHLVDVLSSLGYTFREFLINPLQAGVPNSRLRYYLVARFRGLPTPNPLPWTPVTGCEGLGVDRPPTRLDEFLVQRLKRWDPTEVAWNDYRLDPATVKRSSVLDIVHPDTTGSCCFTKGYRHYAEGTGSVMCCNRNPHEVAALLKNKKQGLTPDEIDKLQLRYFTPMELAALLCFPIAPDRVDRSGALNGAPGQGDDPTHRGFCFHPEATIAQRYRFLGNSVCVDVVARVIEIMLRGWEARD